LFTGFVFNDSQSAKTIMMILCLSILEIVLLLRDIPECSDTANYLGHAGADTMSIAPDAFLYYLLHILDSNHLWFQLIQIISILVFNFSVLVLRIGLASSALLVASPFFFSIVGLHFWSCSIRSGISFSFIILALSLLETTSLPIARRCSNKFLSKRKMPMRLSFITVGILSILLHWSSAFILLAAVAFSSDKFNSAITLLSSYRVRTRSLLIATAIFAFVVTLYILFSSKINSYSLISESSIGYGTKFPWLVLVMLLISFLIFRPCRQSNPLLRSPRGIYILTFAAILSFASLASINSNSIRIIALLQLISVFYLVIDSRYLSRTLIFAGLISPPFAWYSITTYFDYYLS
jgi:hypothetical protein